MSSPSLSLPSSKGSTVRVSIIHAGRTTVPTAFLVQKQIPGHDLIDIPCYSFLIENEQLGKKVLYDLGIMKAWKEKQPPASEYVMHLQLAGKFNSPRILLVAVGSPSLMSTFSLGKNKVC
jgi:hypothetical protein